MLAREWFTTAELGEMALPSLPDDRALRVMAERENWRRPEWEGRYWRHRAPP